jgi:hypothetical protein
MLLYRVDCRGARARAWRFDSDNYGYINANRESNSQPDARNSNKHQYFDLYTYFHADNYPHKHSHVNGHVDTHPNQYVYADSLLYPFLDAESN